MDSIQRRFFPDMTCFGCGPANPKGLQLASFESDDGGVTAEFTPWPEHDNGVGYLNGGIISTVLDCHSAAAVMAVGFRQGWVEAGSGLVYVTAGLDVKFRRPTPLTETLLLRASVTEAAEHKMTAVVELVFEDKVRAEAVADWRRWRPR